MAEVMEQSASVQVLINRLRDDGVKAGQEQADRLLKDAKDKAAQILAEAKAEADKLLNSEEGIVVDDVREGEDSIQDLWEILNHELYGGKQILPFRYEFHAN